MATSSITPLTGVLSRAADRRSDGFFSPAGSRTAKKAAVAMAAGGGRGGAAAAPKFKGTMMREKKLTEMIEEKVKEAKEVCEEDARSDGCKVAWDEVEEISQAKADLRRKLLDNHDPLESFCQENPETDECRIYQA